MLLEVFSYIKPTKKHGTFGAPARKATTQVLPAANDEEEEQRLLVSGNAKAVETLGWQVPPLRWCCFHFLFLSKAFWGKTSIPMDGTSFWALHKLGSWFCFRCSYKALGVPESLSLGLKMFQLKTQRAGLMEGQDGRKTLPAPSTGGFACGLWIGRGFRKHR